MGRGREEPGVAARQADRDQVRQARTEKPPARTPLEARLFLARLRHFLYRDRVEERHAGAKLLAHDFDGMFGFRFAKSHELLAARVLVGQKALGKASVLNLFEDRLHRLAAFFVDHPRAR